MARWISLHRGLEKQYDSWNSKISVSFFQGKQVWKDDRSYEGEFYHNLMHGFGIFRFADGKFYEGFYFNDKKHGYGIFHWANGKRYEGWWVEGKQHGYGILIDKTKR